jgi:hypothetical protein
MKGEALALSKGMIVIALLMSQEIKCRSSIGAVPAPSIVKSCSECICVMGSSTR